jgi:hypothetical protein
MYTQPTGVNECRMRFEKASDVLKWEVHYDVGLYNL